jgi:hypothetical protein
MGGFGVGRVPGKNEGPQGLKREFACPRSSRFVRLPHADQRSPVRRADGGVQAAALKG